MEHWIPNLKEEDNSSSKCMWVWVYDNDDNKNTVVIIIRRRIPVFAWVSDPQNVSAGPHWTGISQLFNNCLRTRLRIVSLEAGLV